VTSAPLHQLLRGTFHFLAPDGEEIRRLFPDPGLLPAPQQIYLDDEGATPLHGFPILASPDLSALAQGLEDYIAAEEGLQVAMLKRQSFDRRLYAARWEKYRGLLAKAIENVTLSSYGRQHPAIFWLYHSLDVCRVLRETPKRVLRIDVEVGRRDGDAVKYLVLEKYMDRAFSVTYDQVNRLATETEEVEDELFPPLLTRMRDNVLIFSETHVSATLGELGSYFAGYLRIDGRDLVQRLEALAEWHAAQLRADGDLRDAVALLLGVDPATQERELLKRSGYLRFLATRRAYDSTRLLSPALVQVWESLLVKLKEFELLHALRRLILPLERRAGALVSRDRAPGRGSEMKLSPATRPLDFMAPWVVDPQVDRCGLIYDISSFSEIISILRWSGADRQDESFRAIFRFQRRVNRFALAHRLTLEKYLGDGAFYSGRDARPVLFTALRVQRYYRKVLDAGFPFDRGLRIALNHGVYRLLPIQSGAGGGAGRYEFFGHGLVELSRLVTGKASREIDEIRITLVNLGYPEAAVNRFFAPLLEQNVDVVDKREEARGFYAYVNQNGNLVNEGIVATGAFIERLSREGGFRALERADDGQRLYVVVAFEDQGETIHVGLRKLGSARLKGLDRLPVYEVVDGEELERKAWGEFAGEQLMAAIEQEFVSSLAGRAAESEGRSE
jgi:hypothetical protein